MSDATDSIYLPQAATFKLLLDQQTVQPLINMIKNKIKVKREREKDREKNNNDPTLQQNQTKMYMDIFKTILFITVIIIYE